MSLGRGRLKNKEHRIIITGTSGVLGSYILRQFTDVPDARVLAMDRRGTAETGEQGSLIRRVVDFWDRDEIDGLIREFNPTCLIHSAATGTRQPRPAWNQMVRINLGLSVALCQAVAAVPGCHFVQISTGLAYRDQGRPLVETDALDTRHPYGATKAAADVLVRSAAAELNVPITVFRPFSFTGRGDYGNRLFPALLRCALEKTPFAMSAGGQVRDHCHAQDIASAVVAAAMQQVSTEPPERIYNLGSGDTRTLRELVASVCDELGLDVKINFGASAYHRFEPMYLVADATRAGTELEWKPSLRLSDAVRELAAASFPQLKLQPGA